MNFNQTVPQTTKARQKSSLINFEHAMSSPKVIDKGSGISPTKASTMSQYHNIQQQNIVVEAKTINKINSNLGKLCCLLDLTDDDDDYHEAK